MNLYDAFNDWLLHITHEKGMSRTSRTTYATHVRRFLRWLEEDGGYPGAPLDAFTTPVLRRFNYSLGKDKLKPTTVRGIFNGLRGFSRFLTDVGAIEGNPAAQVGLPKKNAPDRTACTDAQVQALLDACDRIANVRRAALAKAIVSVFAYTGLRRTEALNLRLQDVDVQAGTITVVNGKGGKRRTIPACRECLDALRVWLTHREQAVSCDWLFLENRSRRLWHDGLHVLFEEVRITAGLRDMTELTPHVLRHHYATKLVRSGGDLKSVQELLGHSSLIVTDRYVHGDAARLREVADLASLQPAQPKDDGKIIRLPQRQQERERPRSRRIAR